MSLNWPRLVLIPAQTGLMTVHDVGQLISADHVLQTDRAQSDAGIAEARALWSGRLDNSPRSTALPIVVLLRGAVEERLEVTHGAFALQRVRANLRLRLE